VFLLFSSAKQRFWGVTTVLLWSWVVQDVVKGRSDFIVRVLTAGT
jgi:hypothetical protein